MLLPGSCGLETSIVNIIKLLFMANQEGRLYITKTTGQQLYLFVGPLLYGFIPSADKAKRMFFASLPSAGHL